MRGGDWGREEAELALGLSGSEDPDPHKQKQDQEPHKQRQKLEPHRQRQILFGEEVVEGFYGSELIVFDVEDGVELGDVEDVANFLGEVKEFEFATGVAGRGEGADQFSDAGAVEVVDAGEVEDDLLFSVGEQVAHGGAEFADFRAENEAAMNVEDGDVRHFAGINLQRHGRRGLRREW